MTSVQTLNSYVLEVAFNEELGGGHQQPWDAITIHVNNVEYPVVTAHQVCHKTESASQRCRRPRYQWVWVVIRWPIFSGDTVKFSYSRENASSPLHDKAGNYLRTVTNFAVTNNRSATKPTIKMYTSTGQNTIVVNTDTANFDYKIQSTANSAAWPAASVQQISGGAAGPQYADLTQVGVPVFLRFDWGGGRTDHIVRYRLGRADRGSNHRWTRNTEILDSDRDDSPLRISIRSGAGYTVGSPSEVCFEITPRTGPIRRCSDSQLSSDPLTAAFDEVPTSHDGSTAFSFQVEFSEEISATAADVEAAIGADNATVTAATLESGSDTTWNITVTPSGTNTVTLTLGLTEDCTATGAICTSDGRKLSNAIAQQVLFSPSVSVADAEATEGDDTNLDFEVTLSAASSAAVTVDYATSDGTATAGDDYTNTSGTLSFAASETSKTVSVPIIDDTTDDDGETFTLTLSNPSGATLNDHQATGTIRNTEDTTTTTTREPDPLTASFSGLPSEHGGADTTFRFTLGFSESVEGLSYVTLRDDAFTVTGGDVKNAKRKVQGSNQDWTIEVEPDGGGSVTITLPSGAVTTDDDRALQAAVTATVSGPTQLTGSFSGVPASHQGEGQFTFELTLSEDIPDLSYVTVRDAFQATGGDVVNASRKNKPKNHRWTIHAEPDGAGTMSISLPSGSITTDDGRSLQSAVSASVAGPVGVGVADAEVDEADGAVLSFTVSLSRAADGAMTVDYATSDGTATAGSDYTTANGTLSFAAGDTSKSIDVTVLDDDHDEGSETLTLTLSNLSAGVLTDSTATGTIKNHDAMPVGLIARFGRTAAVHVVEQIEQRIEAPRAPGFDGRVAGQSLQGNSKQDLALNLLSGFGGGVSHAGAGSHQPMGGLSMGGGAPSQLHQGSQVLPGAGLHPAPGGRQPMNGLQQGMGGFGNGNVLAGSSFALNRQTRSGGVLSFWSQGATSHFSGQDGALSMGGGVDTTMLGADYQKGPLVTGLSLSHSRGVGEYVGTTGGQVSSAVTGLYPWLGYKASERITVWGVAGYGAGDMLLTPEGAPALQSGLSMAMAAAGTRGDLVTSSTGFALAIKADALWVGTSIDGTNGPGGRLQAATAAVTRVRTGLEGSRAYRTGSRMSVTPSLEVGLRHDGGDAETGAGMDVGVGIIVADGASGLAVDVRVRTLVVHQAEGFQERGLAISVSYNPMPATPLGLSARVAPSWGGEAAMGSQAMWGSEPMAGMAHGQMAQGSRLDGEVGYGLPVGRRLVGTPRFGVTTSTYGRNYRVGYGLGVLERQDLAFELGVDAQRRESPWLEKPDNGVLGRATVAW